MNANPTATLSMMVDIVKAMNVEGPMFVRELNWEDRKAYRDLYDMCVEFLDTSEHIDQELDQEGGVRYNDDMDGDFDSAMASAGFGTDEDYGYYGDE